MKYNNIHKGRFLSRPNRFIAHCEIDGQAHVCHVKNTGRCRELLTENTVVLLEKSGNLNRKTEFDLVSVYKGDMLVNMDSAAPNKLIGEYLPAMFDGIVKVKPEYTYGKSRIDFYVETADKKILMEVKGCTLERDGVALFPDAPTERGVKHILELTEACKAGYECYVAIVVQMDGIKVFRPNYATHPEFGQALVEAQNAGVHVIALGCHVREGQVDIAYDIPVELEER